LGHSCSLVFRARLTSAAAAVAGRPVAYSPPVGGHIVSAAIVSAGAASGLALRGARPAVPRHRLRAVGAREPFSQSSRRHPARLGAVLGVCVPGLEVPSAMGAL